MRLWQALSDRGMFGKSQLNDTLRNYMAPNIDTKTGETILSKTAETAKMLYEAEDNIMRFSAAKQLMKDGIFLDKDTKQMTIEEAIKYINSTLTPDYSKPMSELAITLRDSGVVPFMSWTYYSTPILLKQLKEHPTRFLAIAGGWYGINKMMGVDPYDDESAPKGFASQRIVVGKEGDNVTGLRISSMVPQGQLIDPVNTYLEPLTSGIPQNILGAMTNYNFYFRKPITTKEGGEKTYQLTKNFVQNVLPSPDVIDKVYNLAESKVLDTKSRKKDAVIVPKTTTQEALSFLVNLQTYNKKEQLKATRKAKIHEDKIEKKWEDKKSGVISKVFGW
jgi:hypothetical protein